MGMSFYLVFRTENPTPNDLWAVELQGWATKYDHSSIFKCSTGVYEWPRIHTYIHVRDWIVCVNGGAPDYYGDNNIMMCKRR